MSQLLRSTLGNEAWMRANADKLREALPADWSPIDQNLMMRVGFAIKVAGVVWHSSEELARCLEFFRVTGLMETRGAPSIGNAQVRRAPKTFA